MPRVNLQQLLLVRDSILGKISERSPWDNSIGDGELLYLVLKHLALREEEVVEHEVGGLIPDFKSPIVKEIQQDITSHKKELLEY